MERRVLLEVRVEYVVQHGLSGGEELFDRVARVVNEVGCLPSVFELAQECKRTYPFTTLQA